MTLTYVSMGLLDNVPLLGDSGLIGSFSKVASFVAVVLGIWTLLVMKQPPGYAGPLVSWNRPILERRHQDDSCLECDHKKKKARKLYRRRGTMKWKYFIMTYQKCTEGCKCEHMMGRIIWPTLWPKLPWRKTHPIPTLDRVNKIDPTVIDSELTDDDGMELCQIEIDAYFHWRVIRDFEDDAPYRADHNFFVRDLDQSIIALVTAAALRAQNRHDITRLNRDPENRFADDIFGYVNELCEKQLYEYGCEMFKFEIRQATRTPQQVLKEAFTGSEHVSSARVVAATEVVPVVDTTPETGPTE